MGVTTDGTHPSRQRRSHRRSTAVMPTLPISNGYADPDGPSVTSTLTAGPDALYTLPAASVNILRGNIGTASQ